MSPRLVPVNIAQVMVAVDGSDHSMKAAELGIRLAKLWNAQLYFIHVQEKDKIPSWFTKFAETEHIGKGDYFEIVEQRLFGPLFARAKESEIQVFSGIRKRRCRRSNSQKCRTKKGRPNSDGKPGFE